MEFDNVIDQLEELLRLAQETKLTAIEKVILQGSLSEKTYGQIAQDIRKKWEEGTTFKKWEEGTLSNKGSELWKKIKRATKNSDVGMDNAKKILIGEGILSRKLNELREEADISNISKALPGIIRVHESDFQSQLKLLGIIGGTARLDKEESYTEPNKCMQEVKYKLAFLGILGTKWLSKPNKKGKLDLNTLDLTKIKAFLERISQNDGEVKFLLINPNGEGFQRLCAMREDQKLEAQTLEIYHRLMQEHTCLEVRLYDDLPCFRMMFIDDEVLAFSHHMFHQKDYKSSRWGWAVPHLVIREGEGLQDPHPYSLYSAFKRYYDYLWENSKPLENFMLEIKN